MAHLFISAAHKSSGKTTITLGVLELLRRRGLEVTPCKKGPDYIDPIWLSLAAQNACTNLDTFVSSEEEVIEDFCNAANQSDITIIEGNKGLYDGVALDGSNSNAAVAKLLNAPVILVIDCRGITRGIAPLLMGYEIFDKDVTFGGVILNRVGGARHEAKLRASVEHFTGLPVLGAVHENPALSIDEEHLGLVPGNEHANARQIIDTIANTLEYSIDIDRLVKIANTAQIPAKTPTFRSDKKYTGHFTGLKIGIATDEAFGFYYPGDLKRFKEYGAQLIPFSPIHDSQLPANVDALFIGGGFPERYAQALSDNKSLIADVKNNIEAGMPTYAECGGLMYLSKSITWNDDRHNMVGIIASDSVMHPKPQGRGYVRLKASGHRLWPESTHQQTMVSAHEFHYSRQENLPPDTKYAYDMQRGTGIDGKHDGIIHKNLIASYTHMRHTNANPWIRNFLGFVQKIAQKNARKSNIEKPLCPPVINQ